MTGINTVVNVNIDRQTQSVSRAGFGTPAVIGEFAASSTTVPFNRTRAYSTIAEASADALPASVVDAITKILSQSPRPSSVMVGRIDSTDANITASLNAIATESSDWYMYTVVGLQTAKFTLSTALIADNSVIVTINGASTPAVVYSASHSSTMDAIASAIETLLGVGSDAVVDTNSITIANKAGLDIKSLSVAVTLGTSQPTVVYDYILDKTQVLASAAWCETQKKMYGVSDGASAVLDSTSTTDIAYELKALSYARTFLIYNGSPANYAVCAWMGKELPFDPGAHTWAYSDSWAGVTADALTTTQKNAVLGKNANVYLDIANVKTSLFGTVASGEYIDVMRGIDWLEARLQESVYALLVQAGKVPFSDMGLTMLQAAITGPISEAERAGVLLPGHSTITVPSFSSISAADKLERKVTVSFTAKLEGAIHTVTINGVVTV